MILRAFKALHRRLRASRALRSAREASHRRILQGGVKRVLVICYGNIYRSPFCGICLQTHLSADIEVRTSGFHRVAGRSSPARHVEMSRSRGVDLAGHRSSLIGADDVQWADIIVLMDRHNWADLEALGVDPAKLVWLGAFDGGDVEIPDPYELDDAQAERVLDRIQQASAELARRIQATQLAN